MNNHQPGDTELIDRIAAGDWVSETASPPLGTVTTLIRKRRRRRRTIAVGGVGLVCATVAAVVSLQPEASRPSHAVPATSPTQRGTAPAAAPDCVADHVLVAKSKPPGFRSARSQTVYVENIGAAACNVAQLPGVTVGDGGDAVSIDTSVAWGPWVLDRHEAVFISVAAHPHTSCSLSLGQRHKTTINVTMDGVTSSFPIPNLRAMACDVPPVLSGVYVAKAGG